MISNIYFENRCFEKISSDVSRLSFFAKSESYNLYTEEVALTFVDLLGMTGEKKHLLKEIKVKK